MIAVLPSISSATVELEVSSARSRQANEIVVSPVSLYILISSPNVKYDTKMEPISEEPAMKARTEKAGWRMASLAVASAMVRALSMALETRVNEESIGRQRGSKSVQNREFRERR